MENVINVLQTEATRTIHIINDLMEHYTRFTVATGDLEEIHEVLGAEKKHLEWVSSATYAKMLMSLKGAFDEVFEGYDVVYSIVDKRYTTLDVTENVPDNDEGIEPSSFTVTVNYKGVDKRHAQFTVYVDSPEDMEGIRHSRCFRISLFGDIEPNCEEINNDDDANIYDCETFVSINNPHRCYERPGDRVSTAITTVFNKWFDEARSRGIDSLI